MIDLGANARQLLAEVLRQDARTVRVGQVVDVSLHLLPEVDEEAAEAQRRVAFEASVGHGGFL